MLKKAKLWFKSHQKAVIIAVITLLAILLFVFGTQIFLYLNFLLGNDVYLQLSADKEFFQLTRGASEKVTFTASVTTNPFCQANCAVIFEDLSHNQTLEQTRFVLKTGLPFKKEYEIRTEKLGHGEIFYRLTMNCYGEKSFLCQTSQQPTSKSILLIVNYVLSPDEQHLQKQLKEELEQDFSKIEFIEREKIFLREWEKELGNKNIILKSKNLETMDKIMDKTRDETMVEDRDITKMYREQFQEAEKIWQAEDYKLLQQKVQALNFVLGREEQYLIVLEQDYFNRGVKYNQLLALLEQEKIILLNLHSNPQNNWLNQTWLLEINQVTEEFNTAVRIFSLNNSLEEKEVVLAEIQQKLQVVKQFVQKAIAEEILWKEAELEFLINTSKINTSKINTSKLNDSKINPNLSLFNNSDVCERINWYNLELRKNLELGKNLELTIVNNSLNLTFLQICPKFNFIFESISSFNFSNITLLKMGIIPTNFNLSLPTAKCTLFREEKECCLENEPEGNSQSNNLRNECLNNYPIIFLHGHAFNKDVSAEYSLDAFTKIQQKLEEEGYLDAGALSDYAVIEEENSWTKIPSSLTLKVSYYFDVFKEPQKFVFIQTKSESIDTYAVKLKERIDYLTAKTGRKKVIIIAHSMGGLVARRYIQIFGSEKVERLVMLGTPNSGIVGNIVDYCQLKGEQRECRDMDSESLFINKLNREKLPNIPVFNIVGSGCEMENKEGQIVDGDGIVLLEKAEIPGTTNYIIKGDCSGASLLHTDLLDIEKYPKVYKRIKEALRGD